MRGALTGLDLKRLRLWLAAFFLALAAPTSVLVYQAYGQLKWEALHHYQVLAEELATRIDARYLQLIEAEERRAFSDYGFLVVSGDPAAGFVQRSLLSAYPPQSELPGLIGYFQVDSAGDFSTPLLPQAGVAPLRYGISASELEQRRALAGRIRQTLNDNRLVGDDAGGGIAPRAVVRDADEESLTSADALRPSAAPRALSEGAVAEAERAGQAAFDRLNLPTERESEHKAVGNLGRVEDLQLDYRYQEDAPQAQLEQHALPSSEPVGKRARKERSALPEAPTPARAQQAPAASDLEIHIFSSEIDPFEFSLLDSGHFVLFRKVWRGGERFVQGLLLEQRAFLDGVIGAAFAGTALAGMSDLIVAHRGEVFLAFPARAANNASSVTVPAGGALLYQTRLSAPLGDVRLMFTLKHLPAGPGARVLGWVALVLVLVLCGGLYLMYRLGAGQIALARQQQDFVSAVSHELKTPLTSIRMYAEMLRQGWAPEEKMKTYYAFIHDESERLSRLIGNVLQLARMTRNEVKVELKPLTVGELLEAARSRVSSQIERAGFTLRVDCAADAARTVVQVDADAFTQILINLVDNALKFSATAETRVIELGCSGARDGAAVFRVRDHGPGVPRDQMRKIFRLFYRSENELTRETVGTGIGLALVRQLAHAMGGQVDVVNRDPGAEFRVLFPARETPD